MAVPSASAVWRATVLTLLLATVAQCNSPEDYDPLQPVTSDETVSVGGTVTLTCQVDESDNSSLQWSNTAQQTLYFGEKRALRDNRIQLHRSTSTELSITISDVQMSDEGEYTCSIFTMPVRTARASVTVLGVPSKPQISGFDVAVPEGGEVTLSCTSTGSKPPAQLHWYKGEERLTQARPDVVESTPGEPTYSVRSEVTLTVERKDDNALVTCAVVHPSLGSGDKRSDQPLSVLYSPDVKIQPQTDLPKEGEKFYLKCGGSGNPEPTTFLWEKKDGELGPLVKIDGAFLYFEMLNKSDNGVYLCQAGNGIGNQGQGEYTLFVQDMTSTTFSSSTPALSSSSSVPDFSESTSAPGLSTSSVSQTEAVPPSSDHTTTALSNALFPDSSPTSTAPPSTADHTHTHPHPNPAHTHSVTAQPNGVNNITDAADNSADPTAMAAGSGVDHAVIGGVVAVIVFILLCLLIVLGRYLIRHKGTYLTHEAKGSDDAPDADTAIINAEGGHSGAEDKKEYFI